MNDESGATDSRTTRSPMIAPHARAATPQQLLLLRSTRAELEGGNDATGSTGSTAALAAWRCGSPVTSSEVLNGTREVPLIR